MKLSFSLLSRLPMTRPQVRVSTRNLATNFFSLTEADLKAFMVSVKQPDFRAKQVREWVYTNGAGDFNDMKNVPLSLRSQLSESFTLGNLKVATEQISKDGTKKRAYALHDGQIIESVLMPYNDGRYTACISSQAGKYYYNYYYYCYYYCCFR